jgi:hypothetical protein
MATFATVSRGATDLSEVEDRTGSGDARFTGVAFLDGQGHSVEYIRSGDRLVVALTFSAKKTIRDFRVGVEIFSDMGTRVTSSNNWVTGADIASINPGDGRMDLEIDSLSLTPGRYYLTLWIGDSHTLHDQLENCVIMDVESSDYYGCGRPITKRIGSVFLPCRWKCTQLP